MAKAYKTQGKSRPESFLSAHPDMHFTVEQICLSINGSLSAKSSIYRNLSLLCDEGRVRRFRSEDGEACVYQYLAVERSCTNHSHLKCLECGHIEHLECDMSDDMCNHISEHHGFVVDEGRSILYGVCKDCASRTCKKITV